MTETEIQIASLSGFRANTMTVFERMPVDGQILVGGVVFRKLTSGRFLPVNFDLANKYFQVWKFTPDEYGSRGVTWQDIVQCIPGTIYVLAYPA